MDKRAIGIFDSGLGGLTILKELTKKLPKENVIYFGDSARVPYGSKSPETVIQYSLEIAKFLESENIKMLLIACNTASALAITEVIKNVKVPVVGVIEAGSMDAVKKTKNKRVAVIGTSATVRSNSYKKMLKSLDKNIEVLQTAAPLFVPIIEEEWNETKVAEIVAKEYLKPIKASGADTLILGCTHYPIIKKLLKRIMGGKVNLIDSAESVSCQVAKMLEAGGQLNKSGKGKVIIYASDAPKTFADKASKILGKKISKAHLKKFN
ncbi:glutamate racemase [Elusimicrobium simillimum]|uniref:glutamate racemase n=1 Tax=Elusimicrobium simillimum TaxID=3143438 RepID=UPI003C6FAC15